MGGVGGGWGGGGGGGYVYGYREKSTKNEFLSLQFNFK